MKHLKHLALLAAIACCGCAARQPGVIIQNERARESAIPCCTAKVCTMQGHHGMHQYYFHYEAPKQLGDPNPRKEVIAK